MSVRLPLKTYTESCGFLSSMLEKCLLYMFKDKGQDKLLKHLESAEKINASQLLNIKLCLQNSNQISQNLNFSMLTHYQNYKDFRTC
jgi:hypothetical protein